MAKLLALKKLGLGKSNLNDLDDGAYASASDSDELLEPEHGNGDDEDDDDMAAIMESQMEKLYDEYLSRKGDGAKTKKAIKRSKVAKRALAGEALVEDHTMFDGDNEAYEKMIKPRGGTLHSSLHVLLYPPLSCCLFRALRALVQLSNSGHSTATDTTYV